jgi:tetratricopeptide (TPR) repeat protein
VFFLVAFGILRSVVATRLDGFTLDEAYHIAAGVFYVEHHAFQINPEHPPLVKLWVGSVIASTGFVTKPLRQFSDKPDERIFTQSLVFQMNDPDSVQRRARAAMFCLNGLFLICFAFALRRVFDDAVALGALLFLVIDPTVAAHWPVVMTDLPVALLSATAIVLAARAFRDWGWGDLAACSLFLGLALTAKHSAPVVVVIVTTVGVCVALWQPALPSARVKIQKLLKIVAVVAGALAVLWGAYFFHYSESPSGTSTFNRPLAEKIEDVDTPGYHFVLATLNATHIVPRAYLWGFADTIHAGMEGRPFPQLAFGRVYVRKGPKYFFPAMIAVKLPIALSVLVLLGLGLFFARRLPTEWNFPASVTLASIIFFLLVLAAGATYAGIRHALPVVVLLSIFAGIFAGFAALQSSRRLQVVAVAAYLLAMVSALPVVRPWEYFNEFVGTANASKYFSDEGVDLDQRTKELVAYYQTALKPTNQLPDIFYFSTEEELKGRGVDYLGRDEKRDLQVLSQAERTGLFWDHPALRTATPVARFGNLFVYQGTFNIPADAAAFFYFDGIKKLYADQPDLAGAEKDFQQSVQFDPTAFFVHIELANLLLKRGARDEALREYSQSLKYAPQDQIIRQPIEEQIQRVNAQPSNTIPLRNPFLE